MAETGLGCLSWWENTEQQNDDEEIVSVPNDKTN